MSCLFWNYRGLGNPRKVLALKKEILQKDPSFVFLCETKLCVRELERVSRKLGFSGCFRVDCDRSGNGRRGGLGLLWKSDFKVSIQSFSFNHIDALVDEGVDWRFIGIYGHPEDNQKWRTWALIDRLGEDFMGKWLCVGDFNEILYGLSDMGYSGHAYTWSNKQSGLDNIQERLDRGLASDELMETFPSFKGSHLTHFLSDHCPIIIEWEGIRDAADQHCARPFHFETVWLGEQGCTKIIEDVWARNSTTGVLDMAANLTLCGQELKVWGENDFGNIKKEIRNCNKELARLQKAYQDYETVQKAKILEKRLSGLYRMDELYWLQRSRVSWMREGDDNTKFFHKIASGRQKRNFVMGIRDENGILRSERGEMEKVFVDYFSGLFTTNGQLDMEEALGAVERKITNDMHALLSQPFTKEEVTAALSQMHPTKSPGPDGMSAVFFPKILACCRSSGV
ncbi:hypothetical protein ACS0TY_024285 [Phlomoides rotata]